MIKSLKFIVLTIGSFLLVIYILAITYLYFNQESLIFQPEILAKDYKFSFQGDFKEMYIPVEKDVNLHGVLFRTQESKGLIFYLHGNGGSVKGWGDIGATYNQMWYDIFILDYRGYGKSDGKISSEAQLFDDLKKAYNHLLSIYPESKIIITGYSIGTGLAAMLASENNPQALVLQAPYYSLKETINSTMPLMPDFLQKYDFETYKFLQKVKAPVCIFHGTADTILPYSNSEKLRSVFKKNDMLVTLPGEGHNTITDNELFKTEFKKFADRMLNTN